MSVLFDRVLVACAILGTIFWFLVGWFSPEPSYTSFYPVTWLGGFGTSLWFYRDQTTEYLQSAPLSPMLRFVFIGYSVILLEEVVAAFVNHLGEGFSFFLYLIRVGQFWIFNVLAFTGFIVGWYVLQRRYQYSQREVFYLAGLWGLYAESTYRVLFTNPIVFIALAAPTLLIYGSIAMPMTWSLPRNTLGRELPAWKKYPLTLAVIFVLSVLPFIALTLLRSVYPSLFPPATFI